MKKCLALNGVFAAAYFLFWIVQGYPYRLIPADDTLYRHFITNPAGPFGASSTFWNAWNPVTWWFLALSQYGAALVLEAPLSGFLLSTVLPNSLLLGLASVFTYRLTGNLPASLVCAALFGSAAWPVTYHLHWNGP